jgi:hypothetical protein
MTNETPYTIIETADPLKHLPQVLVSSKEPIAAAHAAMIDELSRLRCPSLSVTPSVDEFGAVADYVVALARIADRCLKVVGEEVERNSVHSVDLSVFDGAFLGAVDGNATYEIDTAAERLREDEDEAQAEKQRPPLSDFGRELFEDIARMHRLLYGRES